MNDKELVIFGSGRGGTLTGRMLRSMGYSIRGYVDNDPQKWGTELEGKQINPPESILEHNIPVVIASMWENEIKEQLNGMGAGDRVLEKAACAREYMQSRIQDYVYVSEYPVQESGKKPVFVFGMDLGLFHGGIESWVYVVGDVLKERGFRIKIFTSKQSGRPPERFAEDVCFVDVNGEDYVAGVRDMIRLLLETSPCIVIDSWQNMTMMAASIVRYLNPSAVLSLIEVVHGNMPKLFQAVRQFEPYLDYCMCVSRDLNQVLTGQYQVNPEKVRYKESPVKYGSAERSYETDGRHPVRIGFAGRLDTLDKRADLLMPLMTMLAERKICFRMQIAGVGKLSKPIELYIEEHHLQDCVSYMGFIPREEMGSFWKDQDIFISLSESEGVGLSMLEAVGNGCVPVVTRVSGSTEFVLPEIGYICDIGDLQTMADHIEYLSHHRDEMAQMGRRGMERTRERCSVDSYVDYLLDLTGMSS